MNPRLASSEGSRQTIPVTGARSARPHVQESLTMTNHDCAMPEHGQATAPHACCRPTVPVVNEGSASFWGDRPLWLRASSNTAHCLLGCAIGDIAAMTLIPLWFPAIGMATLMMLAIASGIATSLALETAILRWREHLSWRNAMRTAWGMSLISMAAMELVMNAVDLLAMGGQRMHWHEPGYWLAWGPALAAGFLAVLPYNYAKLKRHGRSCH